MASCRKSAKKRKMSRKLNENEEVELDRLEKLVLRKGNFLEDSDELMQNEEIKTDEAVKKKKIENKKPAWEDPDDLDLKVQDALEAQGRPKMGVPEPQSGSYRNVLKKRFESRVGNPNWARLDRNLEDDLDEGDDILKRCGNFIEKEKKPFTSRLLDIKKLKNLNKATGKEGPYINSVQFHPTSTAALVAGTAGIASIFQVDGQNNPHLQSVKFERFPIRCARFSQDGNQFIVGSQHYSHYYVYDMMEGRSIRVPSHHATEQTHMKKFEVSPDGTLIAVCGRFGNIHLLHSRSREWIGSLKMNGEVLAICFNSSGSQLWSHGDGGEVYVWDMASRKCLHRFIDDGCLQGTSIAVSSSGQLVACGSNSGVVNVYETETVLKSAHPQPSKALMHLVTPATCLQFNPTSQILAMASDEKDGACKLVHLPSITVFNNFPAKDTLIGRVQCQVFSPSSGYLAVGNSQHTVKLFRLRHFGNY